MNFKVPELLNEEIKDYKKNSKERLEVEKTYDNLYNQNIKIPLYICKITSIKSPRWLNFIY